MRCSTSRVRSLSTSRVRRQPTAAVSRCTSTPCKIMMPTKRPMIQSIFSISCVLSCADGSLLVRAGCAAICDGIPPSEDLFAPARYLPLVRQDCEAYPRYRYSSRGSFLRRSVVKGYTIPRSCRILPQRYPNSCVSKDRILMMRGLSRIRSMVLLASRMVGSSWISETLSQITPTCFLPGRSFSKIGSRMTGGSLAGG